MIRILSISTNPHILDVMDRLVNQQKTWKGMAAGDMATAESLLLENDFDLALLGTGVTAEAARGLADLLKSAKKNTRLVQHFGGGSGLLYSEVVGALGAEQ